jgi:hypothetical protein
MNFEKGFSQPNAAEALEKKRDEYIGVAIDKIEVDDTDAAMSLAEKIQYQLFVDHGITPEANGGFSSEVLESEKLKELKETYSIKNIAKVLVETRKKTSDLPPEEFEKLEKFAAGA